MRLQDSFHSSRSPVVAFGRVAATVAIVALLYGGVLTLPFDARGLRPAPEPVPSQAVASGSNPNLSRDILSTAPVRSIPRTSGEPPVPTRGAAGSGVNPDRSYSKEPAPMGLSDFGVNASLVPYAYNTTEFVGTVDIQRLAASVREGGSVASNICIKLDAVVRFVNQTSGQNLTYWVIDSLDFNASDDEFYGIGNTIWNFSSSSATVGPRAITGNGTVTGGAYQYFPVCSATLGGYCTTITLPQTLQSRLVALTDDGVAEVGFDYSLGNGWIRYDTARFPQARGLDYQGFYVSGYAYSPGGAYDNVEWVYAGLAPGNPQTDRGSEMNFTLQYWNGHNLQSVPSAWNHGGDIGESVSNVTVSGDGLSGGLPGSHLVNGNGDLGIAYDTSQVGSLLVTCPVDRGTLEVNGTVVAFVGGMANLTLAPGPYDITLENSTSPPQEVTVLAGSTSSLLFRNGFMLVFESSGLPVSTTWGLTVGTSHNESDGSSVSFYLPNGSYSIHYDHVPGYVPGLGSPETIMVLGPEPGPILLAWVPFDFAVPVTESGLPSGTLWWIQANGALVSGTGSSLLLQVPNGSTDFTAGSAYEFVAMPSAGVLNVTGGLWSMVLVSFSYRLTFVVGTVVPATATVTVSGSPAAVRDGAFNVSVIPGVYYVNATAPGHQTKSLLVSATPGNATRVQIQLNLSQSTSVVGPSGDLEWTLGAILGSVLAAAVLLGVIVWRRRPPPRAIATNRGRGA
jgi:Thermopsin